MVAKKPPEMKLDLTPLLPSWLIFHKMQGLHPQWRAEHAQDCSYQLAGISHLHPQYHLLSPLSTERLQENSQLGMVSRLC